MVGVGEVAKMVEEHGNVRSSVSQGRAEQNSFFSLPAPGCALHIGQVIVSHSLELEVVVGGDEAEGEGSKDRRSPGREDENQNENRDPADDG